MAIKGAALDTRIQTSLLYDPKLNGRVTDGEFRSFIRLMVWVVAQVTDGAFLAEDADGIVEREDIDRLTEVGLVECDSESGWYRIHPDYWDWQTPKAQLEALASRREADRLRKRAERAKEPELKPVQPF